MKYLGALLEQRAAYHRAGGLSKLLQFRKGLDGVVLGFRQVHADKNGVFLGHG